MMDKLPGINLPVWMNKGEPLTLAHASETWWQRVYGWLTFPLAQIDIDNCDEQLLSLLAYQRDITRIPGESLGLLRLRVKYAFVNAQDSGSRSGFERIFQRLEIGTLQQLERQLTTEWDVIVLRINDEQLSRDNALLMELVRQYGRTCRRYFFDVLNQSRVTIWPGEFSAETSFIHAKWIMPLEIIGFIVNGIHLNTFRPQSSFTGAKYQILIQSEGPVLWSSEGAAKVDSAGNVMITGPGPARIFCKSGTGQMVSHIFNPLRFFTPSSEQMSPYFFESYTRSQEQRLPARDELTNADGSLWKDWGNMEEYGWRDRRSETDTTQELWATDYSYIDSNITGRIYTLAGLRTGQRYNHAVRNYIPVYSVATVIDLETD